MAKLYNLTENYNNLLELLDNPEMPQEMITESLNQVREEIEVKAENIAKLIKSIDVDIKGFKDEESRLSAKRKALENRAEGLKGYLETAMRSTGKDKIKGKVFTLALQLNQPSVDVVSEGDIPKEYFTEQSPVLNKKMILEDIKNGKQVPGVILKRTQSIRIK